MKKRLLTLFLALTMLLALSACGGPGQAESGAPGERPPAAEPQPEETPQEPEDLPAEEEADDGADPAGPPAKPAETPAKPAEKPAKPAEKPAASVDLTAFFNALTADGDWPAMMEADEETLDSFYKGLSDISTKQCGVYLAMMSATGMEIALVETSSSADVQAVKDIFQARVDYQVGTDGNPGGAWYPEPTEMWKNQSRIVSNGNFVMLAASGNADAVVEAFNALFQ